MQNIVDAAKNVAAAASTAVSGAATTATTAVSGAAATAASYTGLGGAHSHAEEHLGHSNAPADATFSEVRRVDEEGLAVFEAKEVRHEVLVKINQLALDDKKHGLKELAALELTTDKGNRGIDFYHPLRYFTVQRPMGVDYIGEIEIEEGKCIHIRCHKSSAHAEARFHSLDTRPGQDGGAVFKTGDKLSWFDY